jgi:hypothetical protein
MKLIIIHPYTDHIDYIEKTDVRGDNNKKEYNKEVLFN